MRFRRVVLLLLITPIGERGRADDPANAAASIPVVETWQDLLDVDAIDLGGGVTVRLGVEAAEAPKGSGFLLYCLTEGFQPPPNWSRSDLMGPVVVDYSQRHLNGIGGGRSEDPQALSLIVGFGWEAHQEQPAGLDNCRLLFVREIYVVEPEPFVVRVSNREGTLLATAEVRGTDAPYHPWMPWEQLDSIESADDADYRVRNRTGAIALPYVFGVRPTVFEGIVAGVPVRTPHSERLPQLVPDEPSPGFRITVSDSVITVNSTYGINVWGANDHFLTRWWVNGEPILPSSRAHSPSGPSEDVFDAPTNAMRIRVELDLDELGARPGDRIGLQLLHCDDRWDWVSSSRSFTLKAWERNVLPKLSNRVEFVAD